MRWARFVSCAAALAIGLILLAAARSVWAVGAVDLLVPQMTAERHGLTRAWFTQVPAAGGLSRVTHVVQDEGLLLVTTSSAMLYAIDAETGRIVWSTQVGEPNFPTLRPAANGKAVAESTETAPPDKLFDKADATAREISLRRDKVVAVVNGTTLYLLNRTDGSFYLDPTNNIQWKVALRGVPEAGPLVTEDMVYVPISNGPIEVRLITDTRRSATMQSSSGHNLMPLVQVGERIAWATDKGVLQVTEPKTLVIRHRIETTGPITAMLSSYPPQVFAGSIDGYLYCVNENSGEVIWKVTAGSPIRESPVVIRGAVFITPDDGGMFRASADDGRQAWFNPAARHFLAASPTKVYALDAFGHMLILNAKTGATIDSMPMPEAALPVLNDRTDRVILTSDAGLLQCLHEPELTQPENYAPLKPEKPAVEPVKVTKPKPVEDADKPKPAPKEPPAPKEKVDKPAPIPKTPRAPITRRGKQPM